MTLQRRERKFFRKLVADIIVPPKALLPIRAQATHSTTDVANMAFQLGLHPVITPAPVNCLAMDIAQAAMEASLYGPDTHLEMLTDILKRGIKLTGLLDLDVRFAHDDRFQALAGVRLG